MTIRPGRSRRRRATTRDESGPIRTCVGCGRKAAQRDLVRFGAVDGVLTPSRSIPGRGAYTCRRLECFRQARERRGFARTLRTAVSVEPGLERLYTEESHG